MPSLRLLREIVCKKWPGQAKTYKKLRLEPVTLTLATRPQPFYATLRLPKLYHCAKFEVAALKSVKEMSRTSESIQKLRLDTVTLTLTPRPQLFYATLRLPKLYLCAKFKIAA